MANPLSFRPQPVDPHLELERRLASAPRTHAEALLVVYDILDAAHENGTLDAVHGLIAARDKIAGKLAEFARTPEGKDGLLNHIEIGKVLVSVDPQVLEKFSRAMQEASTQHQQESSPPSTWQLFRRATSEDGRRGLSFFTFVLTTLGRSLKH
jgi:uncharacterized protein YjgD (DUF1641 family)